jgi:tetratricopeptide (TPR) repeat protein
MTTTRPPLRDSYEGLQSRAQHAIQSGDAENAIGLYRRLVEKLNRLSDRVLARRPDLRDMHRQARLQLAYLLRMEGRYAEAIEVEEVLLETHPDEADIWRTDLAALRVAKGEVETGLAELRALAEEKSEEPAGWMILGTEARIEGRFAEAEAALDRALVAATEGASGELSEDAREAMAEIYYQRFHLYKGMGRLDDAIAAWEEALKREPDVGDTVREVYTMLTDAGRYSQAMQYVDRDANALQAGFQRGIIDSLTGHMEDARQEWQTVAGLNPDEHEHGHDCWVEAVLRLGDPEPALEWLQENLGQRGTPRLFVLSGIGWAMRQDAELAGVLFQQAINMQRWRRPRKQKLDSADWQLLDSLVSDDEIKTPLKTYFAVVETLWG